MFEKSIYKQIVLEDDDTPYGGTSFDGETLEDVLEEFADSENIRTIKDVNQALVECGIKPVMQLPEDHEITAFAVWDEFLEGFGPAFINFSYQELLTEVKNWLIEISQSNEDPYTEDTPVFKMLREHQWCVVAIDFPTYNKLKRVGENNMSWGRAS